MDATVLPAGTWLHKDCFEIATADPCRDSEVRHLASIGGELAALERALLRMALKRVS